MQNALVKFMGDAGENFGRRGIGRHVKGMAVTAYGLTFAPSAHSQSKFEVVEYEDSVIVAARQGNVIVADGADLDGSGRPGINSQEEDRRRSPRSRGQSFAFREDLAIIGGASGATVASILIAESDRKKKCVSSSNNKKCKCREKRNTGQKIEIPRGRRLARSATPP